jgi:hypothetical protein
MPGMYVVYVLAVGSAARTFTTNLAGLYTLRVHLTHSLKAAWFQPSNL